MKRTPAEQVRAVIANLQMVRELCRAAADKATSLGAPIHAALQRGQSEAYDQSIQLIKTECAEILAG